MKTLHRQHSTDNITLYLQHSIDNALLKILYQQYSSDNTLPTTFFWQHSTDNMLIPKWYHTWYYYNYYVYHYYTAITTTTLPLPLRLIHYHYHLPVSRSTTMQNFSLLASKWVSYGYYNVWFFFKKKVDRTDQQTNRPTDRLTKWLIYPLIAFKNKVSLKLS